MASFASANPVYGSAFLASIIGAYKTAPMNPLIDTAKVRLSNNPAFVASPGSTVAELDATECAYSGYAAGGIALVVGAPVILSATCEGAVTALQFLATSATPFVSDTAYGYWIDDGVNVILSEPFSVPGGIPFAAAGNFLELIVQLPQQAPQATQ